MQKKGENSSKETCENVFKYIADAIWFMPTSFQRPWHCSSTQWCSKIVQHSWWVVCVSSSKNLKLRILAGFNIKLSHLVKSLTVGKCMCMLMMSDMLFFTLFWDLFGIQGGLLFFFFFFFWSNISRLLAQISNSKRVIISLKLKVLNLGWLHYWNWYINDVNPWHQNT